MEANFFTSVLLPTGLAIVMLGMGLTLLPEDFQRVTRYPKVAIGLVSQLLFLPIVGFLVASIVPMQPEIAVGLMVLALCPDEPSSNMITYLTKGDVALSVTLSTLSNAITVFTIPIFANLSLQYFMGQNVAIILPIGQTMLQIFEIAHCASWVGNVDKATVSRFSPPTREDRKPSCCCLSRFNYLSIVVREWDRIPTFIAQVGIAVALLNVISMALGFWFGKLFNLKLAQRICIAIEVGIQNGTRCDRHYGGITN